MLKSIKYLKKCPRGSLKTSVRYISYPDTFWHFLRNMPPLQVTRLTSGLTVATEERNCCAACVGLFVAAGPRYENDFENGITHFFEHVAFKETSARTRALMEDQINRTGAMFQCHTSRDIASYYAACLNNEVPLVVDLLADCVYNNRYDEKEIEEQKKIVYTEMLELEEDANVILNDYLHSTAFQGSPLEQSVMGPSRNLHNFNAKTISTFMKRCYGADRTILAAVGGVKHEQMLSLGETYLGKLETTKCIDRDVYRFTGSQVTWRNDCLPVANVAIAVEGCSLCDDDNITLEVAKELVGGWDRSQPGTDHAWTIARGSALHGVCDAYRAFNISYKDTGLWGVQFMGPTLGLDDTVLLVQDQWLQFSCSVTDEEVERAKSVLVTKFLSRSESLAGTCRDVGRWVVYQGGRPELHKRVSAVEAVRAPDVRRVLQHYVVDRCPAVAALGPTEGLSDYTRLRAGMYWLRL